MDYLEFKTLKLEELSEVLVNTLDDTEREVAIEKWFNGLFKEYRAETLLTSFEIKACKVEDISRYTKQKLREAIGFELLEKGQFECKKSEDTALTRYTIKLLVANINSEK